MTDEGVKELAVLANLAALDLREADVTDKGLKGLAPLKKLTHLNLSGTKVTDAGALAFRAEMPKCSIDR